MSAPRQPMPLEAAPRLLLLLLLLLLATQLHTVASHPEPRRSILQADASGQALRRPRPAGCKRLLWFTALSELRDAHQYWEHLFAAVMSAKVNAPSLQPVLIYLGNGSTTGVLGNERTAWFEAQGGLVAHHQLTFKHLLEDAVRQQWTGPEFLNYQGAFGRLDADTVLEQLRPRFNPSEIELENVLYTDVDVLFFKDLHSCSLSAPRMLAFGAEHERGKVANTGVMYLKASILREHRDGLLELAQRKRWSYGDFDQGLLRKYFGDQVEYLPDRFNWKPYWPRTAEDQESQQVAVVHFHGPKPEEQCTRCYVAGNRFNDPDCNCNANMQALLYLAETGDGGAFFRHAVRAYQHMVDLARKARGGGAAAAAALHHQEQQQPAV